MRKRLVKAVAAVAVTAVGLVGPAGAAGAIDDGEPSEPPPPSGSTRPNLRFAATGLTNNYSYPDYWNVSYTVKNTGQSSSGYFKVAFHNNGTTLVVERSHASLAPGATTSGSFSINKAGHCYIPLRFKVDSGGVVAESSETDNTIWRVQMTDTACPELPVYKVKAVSFRAVDETGWHWSGSDEPYWTFNTVGTGGTAGSSVSSEFGDVDTSETRYFGATEGCLWRASCGSATAPYGIGFSTQVWEHDYGNRAETLYTIGEYFKKAGSIADLLNCPAWVGKALGYVGEGVQIVSGWAEDDYIGSQTYAYSADYLAARLTYAGASFTDTRSHSDGGDGNYDLNVSVTRVG